MLNSRWSSQVSRDQRLEVDGAALGVDADARVVEHELADVRRRSRRVSRSGGQGVVVGDDEEALVLVAEADAVLQRADVVAEVELPGGAVAGEDPALLARCCAVRVIGVVTFRRHAKRPSSRQGRGALSWCHPVSAAEREARACPLRARPSPRDGEALHPDNGGNSGGAYLTARWSFGPRLPGPFAAVRATGSHLPRLSEARSPGTRPVRVFGLCSCLEV